MKLNVVVACAVLAVASASPVKANEALAKPYPVTGGDLVALALPQVLAITGPADVQILSAYDRDKKQMIVFVYGTRSTADGAKTSLETVRASLKGPVAGLFKAIYNLSLDEQDWSLAYYHGDKEILDWENGQYVMK